VTRAKINERILQGIRKNCGGDEAIESFLVALVYEEAERTGQWWWREVYNRYLSEFVNGWEEDDED
jgi:hypothetical protein